MSVFQSFFAGFLSMTRNCRKTHLPHQAQQKNEVPHYYMTLTITNPRRPPAAGCRPPRSVSIISSIIHIDPSWFKINNTAGKHISTMCVRSWRSAVHMPEIDRQMLPRGNFVLTVLLVIYSHVLISFR